MKNIFYLILFMLIVMPSYVVAQNVEQHIQNQNRLSLARSFVSKLKNSLSQADKHLLSIMPNEQANILSEGEILLLQPILEGNLRIDGVMLGRVHNKKIMISLRDFAKVLQIPIDIDLDNNIVEGWYIRENKFFNMDLSKQTVRTDVGEFTISDNIIIEDGDVFVASDDLGQWIDFEFNPVISSQELRITSSELLPIQERYRRRNENLTASVIPEPSLPLINSEYEKIGIPVIDVSTRSVYRKDGDSAKGADSHSATIRTAGDFAEGTLRTQSQFNNVDRLKSVRVNYTQESVDGDLLGVLRAKKFEVGDITTAALPLGGSASQEFGARVTNTDSLRTFSSPETGISGNYIPGWDIELYRGAQLVGFQEIGDDGFYNFKNVELFHSGNNFRLVFYGPQGEVREENLFVPVDPNLLSRGGGIYDISVSLEDKSTYNKLANRSDDEDSGSINLAAIYERPIADGVTVLVGARSNEVDGDRNNVGNIGLSATVGQVLLNAGLAVDDEGEISTELAARHDFGEHEVGNKLSWRGEGFDDESGSVDIGALKNRFSINGPLPLGVVNNPRYNFSTNYTLDTNDDYSINSSAGLNASWRNLNFNEVVAHSSGSELANDKLNFRSNIAGSYGRNRLRIAADYKIKPDSELENVLAKYSRDITNDLDFEMAVNRRPQTNFTEYSAKIDWQAGFMRISPSVSYNNEQDFFAGLNTRFGVLKEPSHGRIDGGGIKTYDRNLTNSGIVSAFVYLDKNGDGNFNGDDEPLEDVIVTSLQNGGRKYTDENGVALFTSMSNLRLTDVFIDPDALQDPVWVSGSEGVSILPRAGYVAEINFPVHISGEIDGYIYARDHEMSKSTPLRRVRVKLYNDKGEIESNAVTDAGGFYYISRIHPGRYLLVIDEKSAKSGNFIRPEPQQIEITYDGTVIYGNDLYVKTGAGDIPSAFLSDLGDYKSRHPHIDFSNYDNDIILNLGEFNSRLLMSVVWYKIRARYSHILAGGNLYVPPTKSYANTKTGKHELRVGLKSSDLSDAYSRCRALMARSQYCKVEIYPSYMKHAKAE